jgi:capsular polysaccharide biosynthesis protein
VDAPHPADVPAGTALVRISVSDCSAYGAALLANTVQSQLSAVAGSVAPSTGGTSSTTVVPVETARAPAATSSLNVLVDLLLGALVGGVLGFAAVIGPTIVRDRRRSPLGGDASSSKL